MGVMLGMLFGERRRRFDERDTRCAGCFERELLLLSGGCVGAGPWAPVTLECTCEADAEREPVGTEMDAR